MKNIALTLSAVALLGAAPAQAQDGSRDATAARAATPSQTADLPNFLPASFGTRTPLETPDGTALGTIRDHVVDAGTGRITHVAVQPGAGETTPVLVPFERFAFETDSKRLVLALTAEELANQPEFQPRELRVRATEAGARTDGSVEAKGASAKRAPRWVLSSEVNGHELWAQDVSFGEVSELLLDRKKGQVAFVLVTTEAGTDPVLIPWSAITWTPSTKDGEPSFQAKLAHSTEHLANAPRLVGGDVAALDSNERLAVIREFFSVPVSPRN